MSTAEIGAFLARQFDDGQACPARHATAINAAIAGRLDREAAAALLRRLAFEWYVDDDLIAEAERLAGTAP